MNYVLQSTVKQAKENIQKYYHTTPLTSPYSVVDPELFIPDPDPAWNFLSSGSRSRQKFWIQADPDQIHFI